jgi:Zn finger protein HypA/HybF involved in hydrogenase expression
MATSFDDEQITFIKGEWLDGNPIAIHCRCGGMVTILPPFSEQYVVCPKCESKLFTPMEGDQIRPQQRNLELLGKGSLSA